MPSSRSWQFLAQKGHQRGARAFVDDGVDAEDSRADAHAHARRDVGAAAQHDLVAHARLQPVGTERVAAAQGRERDPHRGERFPGVAEPAAAVGRQRVREQLRALVQGADHSKMRMANSEWRIENSLFAPFYNLKIRYGASSACAGGAISSGPSPRLT